MLTTYLAVLLFLSLGFFGLGALASVGAAELRDPMQPPPLALRKMRQALAAQQPQVAKPKADQPETKTLQLTSILISPSRRIAIIDNQMLAVGDRIRGARLVKLTRESARLVRQGKVIELNLGNHSSAIRKKVAESNK
ncbi:MAG: hypothetical protein QNJ85_11470 [Gammaproteobacteria bacterium]|nr:hypothetical protein [Gammaproteobacteria bacterium]